MISFAAPGFLIAGGLLALVPLALHMLARTPPERRPLPTARFLTVDRRTRLRLRRPSDLALLALRVAFLLLLAGAFAGPEWVPDRAGVSVVVLLDAGEGMAPVWDEAVAAARDRIGDDGALVIFDTAARVAADPAAVLDSLRATGPGEAPARYLVALRGLRAAAGALPAASATAVLVTRPRWGAWSPGVAAAREAAWPARIEVVGLEGPPRSVDRMEARADGDPSGVEGAASRVEGEAAEARAAALLGPEAHPLRPYVAAALRALEYAPGSDTTASLVVVLPGPDTAGPRGVAEARRVILPGGPLGGLGERGGASPWTESRDEARPRSRGRLVLPGGLAMEGWVPRGGELADGSVVVAVWEDGRPAAAARSEGESCVAYLAADPETPAVAADPAFPRLLRALANACAPGAGSGGARDTADDGPLDEVPLDGGALTVLRGDALPTAAALLSAAGPRSLSLARLLGTLAALVALAEAAMSYGRRGKLR